MALTNPSLGYKQITSLATATGLALTQTQLQQASYVLIGVEGADVRWRDDGTAPTVAVGNVLKQDQSMQYTGDANAIQFIAVSGAPKLNVNVFGG